MGFLGLALLYPLASAKQTAGKKGAGKEIFKVQYTSHHLRSPFKSPFETEMGLEPKQKKEPKTKKKKEKSEKKSTPKAQVELPDLHVQGMIWDSDMPQAIINNTVLRIGESIEGAKLLDIRKEGVHLQYSGKHFIIRPSIPKN